jgi:alanine racemase
MDISKLNTWIEISEAAYAHNLNFFRSRLSPATELSAVVKSNAYGHGLTQIANLALKYGADSFCVHSLEEALTLRKAGIECDILVMGHIPIKNLRLAVENNLRLVLYNGETLAELARIGLEQKQPCRVHLKLETGTYRQGITQEQIPEFLELIKRTPEVKLEAIYTHYANIEDTTNHDYAFSQLNKFKEMASLIESGGFPGIKKHTACSAAILLFPETYFDMVRLGISQYGLWPSRETYVSYKITHTKNGEDVLKPVLTWKARVSQVKDVPADHRIGYGCTYQTTRRTRIAVLPVGYADGYDRHLSNQSYVLIHGRRAPVRGRVCMNLLMVDVTDIPEIKLEDEVVLLGAQGGEGISVEYLAGLCGSINYEFVTRINPAIPRIIV